MGSLNLLLVDPFASIATMVLLQSSTTAQYMYSVTADMLFTDVKKHLTLSDGGCTS